MVKAHQILPADIFPPPLGDGWGNADSPAISPWVKDWELQSPGCRLNNVITLLLRSGLVIADIFWATLD
jgi:hypothetical protein